MKTLWLTLPFALALPARLWAAQAGAFNVGSTTVTFSAAGTGFSTITVNTGGASALGAADFILQFDSTTADIFSIQALANDIQGSVYFSTASFSKGSIRIAAINGASTRTPTGLLPLLGVSFTGLPGMKPSTTNLSAQVLTMVDTGPVTFFPILTTPGALRVVLPPRTTLAAGTPIFSSAPFSYVTAATTFSLTAADDFSTVGDGLGPGVARTFIAIDASTFSAYGGVFNLRGEGLHSVRFYSVDVGGNPEVARSTTIAVDLTPPVTQLRVQSASGTDAQGNLRISTAASLTLSSIDPISNGVAAGVGQILFQIDGSPLRLYAAPFTLSAGTHTLAYFAKDAVGNQEKPRTSSITVVLDSAPPRTALSVGSPIFSSTTLYATDVTTFGLTAVDDLSLFGDGAGLGVAQTFVAIDTAAFSVYSATFSLTAEGVHALQFYSVDVAGNVELVHRSSVAIDLTSPITQLQILGSSATSAQGMLFISSSTPVALNSTDPLSNGVASGVDTIFYVIDANPFDCPAGPPDDSQPSGTCANQTYQGPFTLSAGPHSIYFLAEDNVLNQEIVKVASVTVDATPPSTLLLVDGIVVFSSTIAITSTDTLSLAASDIGSGVAATLLSIDSAPVQVYASTFSLPSGAHTVAFQSRDNVGNMEALHTVSVMVGASQLGGPPFVVNGLAIAVNVFDPNFKVWEISQESSTIKLSRYPATGGPTPEFAVVLPDAMLSGRWTIDFDFMGNTYAVGTTSGPLTVGQDVAVFQVSSQGVLTSSATFHDGMGGRAFAFDTTRHIRISGAVQDGNTTTLALWRYDTQTGLLTRTATYARGNGFDTGLGLRFLNNELWVVGYSASTSQGADGPLDLALWVFDQTGQTLLGGPYLRPNYLPRLSGDVQARIAATPTHLFVGAERAGAGGERDLAFLQADAAGRFLMERLWVPRPGQSVVPEQAIYKGGRNLDSILGTINTSTGSMTGIWAYKADGTPFAAITNPAVRGAKGMANGQSDVWLAVDGSSVPYSFQATQALSGTDVFISSMTPDLTPPITTLTLGRPFFIAADSTAYVSPASSLTLTAIDPRNPDGSPGTGVFQTFYTIDVDPSSPDCLVVPPDDAAPPGTCANENYGGPFTLAPGTHTVFYFSDDNANNSEPINVTVVNVDNTPPLTSLNFTPAPFINASSQAYISGATVVSLTAVDPISSNVASGVAFTEYRLDASTSSAPFLRYVSSFTLAEGLHYLDFRSQDNVGNQEAVKSFTVRVDTTAPQTALSIGQPQALLPGNVVLVSSLTPFALSAFDPLSHGVVSGLSQTRYQINGAPLIAYTTPFTLSVPDGNVTIGFQSTDNVGNQEILKSSTVVLDSTPPAASLMCPSAQGFCAIITGRGATSAGGDKENNFAVGKGVVPVIGSVADLHLASWRLEYAPGQNASSTFTLIAVGTAAVSSNSLGTWDASKLSGWQTLRLTATDLVANQTIVSENVFVGDPAVLLSVSGFEKPTAVAVGPSGLIYVADTNRDRIVVLTSTGGSNGQFGRREKPKSLDLSRPSGVAVDATGNIYIADTGHNRVLKLLPSGQLVLTLGKTRKQGGDDDSGLDARPGSSPGEFKRPTGLAVDASGVLFVSDTGNHRIQKFGPGGNFLLVINLPSTTAPRREKNDDEERDDSQLGRPVGLALDLAGNIYVADQAGYRVLKYDPLGNLLQTLTLGLKAPTGVAVSSSADCLVVADTGNDRLVKLDRFGAVNLVFGRKQGERANAGRDDDRGGVSALNRPSGLAFDAGGNIVLANRGSDQVLKLGAPMGSAITASLTKPVFTPTSASAWISQAAGGVFARPNGAGISVPPGALPQNMTITVADAVLRSDLEETVKARKQNGANLVVVSTGVEFSPDGTQFKLPVTITVPYDPGKVQAAGLSEMGLQVFFWNRDKHDWQWQASTVDLFHHTVSAQVFHFSTYQVMGRKPKQPTAAPTTQPRPPPGAPR